MSEQDEIASLRESNKFFMGYVDEKNERILKMSKALEDARAFIHKTSPRRGKQLIDQINAALC